MIKLGSNRIQRQKETLKITRIATDLLNRTSGQYPNWREYSGIYQLGRIKMANCGATMGQGQGQCTTVS